MTFQLTLTHFDSLWLWRWLPHMLSKRQSLLTTVLLRTTFTWTIMFILLINAIVINTRMSSLAINGNISIRWHIQATNHKRWRFLMLTTTPVSEKRKQIFPLRFSKSCYEWSYIKLKLIRFEEFFAMLRSRFISQVNCYYLSGALLFGLA